MPHPFKSFRGWLADEEELGLLAAVVRPLFGYPRKTIGAALAKALEKSRGARARAELEAAGLDLKRRIGTLDLEELLGLARIAAKGF